ncbi:MAG: hypothetical protein ACKVPX_18850 [Myxococcaceae bacterium]
MSKLLEGKPVPVGNGMSLVLDVFADPRHDTPTQVEIPAHHELTPGSDPSQRIRSRRVVVGEPPELQYCPPEEPCRPQVKNAWSTAPSENAARATHTTVRVTRSANGGLDTWDLVPTRYAEHTVLHAAIVAIDAAERISYRPIPWGARQSGVLRIEVHGLAGNEAHVDPKDNVLRLGAALLPYSSGMTGVYELGRNWKVVAHELWHGIFSALKPFRERVPNDALRNDVFIVNEALADVFAPALWLQNKAWAAELLRKTGGKLARSTELSQLVEPDWAANGVGFRTFRDLWNDDVFSPGRHDLPHNPGQALSGALFRVLIDDYQHYRATIGQEAALELASTRGLHRMFRALDEVGEYGFTVASMGQALIRAEQGAFGGRALPILTAELTRRNIIGANAQTLRASTASLPQIPQHIATAEDAQGWVQENAQALSPGKGFGVAYAGFEKGRDGSLRVWTRLTHPSLARPIAGEGLLVRDRKGMRAVHSGLPDGLSVDQAERLVADFNARMPKVDEHTRFVAKKDGTFALWIVRPAGGELLVTVDPKTLTVASK